MAYTITSDQAFDMLTNENDKDVPISGLYFKANSQPRYFAGILNRTDNSLTGGRLTYNPKPKGNIVYWDVGKQWYRTIKASSLRNYTLRNVKYTLKLNAEKKNETR